MSLQIDLTDKQQQEADTQPRISCDTAEHARETGGPVAIPIDKMPMARIFFSKKGRAKYTSHLDTVRTLSRAFRRSGLPVWYTQGFNPHIYMTFALPIALGYESDCESVDIRLTEPTGFAEVTQRLDAALPPGFTVIKTQTPVQDPQAIAWADYDIGLVFLPKDEPVSGAKNTCSTKQQANCVQLQAGAKMDVALIKGKLHEFFALPVIEVPKKTKKGEKLIDIKPLCEVLSSDTAENVLLVKLRTASGNTLNINPTLPLKAFYSWANIEPDSVRILRTAILNAEKQAFE